MDNLICHLCGGFLTFLGQLGRLMHFRCRNCGMGYSIRVNKVEELEGEDYEEAA